MVPTFEIVNIPNCPGNDLYIKSTVMALINKKSVLYMYNIQCWLLLFWDTYCWKIYIQNMVEQERIVGSVHTREKRDRKDNFWTEIAGLRNYKSASSLASDVSQSLISILCTSISLSLTGSHGMGSSVLKCFQFFGGHELPAWALCHFIRLYNSTPAQQHINPFLLLVEMT